MVNCISYYCLLQAILQDLFPGVEIPEHDYGTLEEEIKNVVAKNKLQTVQTQVKKIIQFYETMEVRHGVMLVGPTGGGKTTVYNVSYPRQTQCTCDKKQTNKPWYSQYNLNKTTVHMTPPPKKKTTVYIVQLRQKLFGTSSVIWANQSSRASQ